MQDEIAESYFLLRFCRNCVVEGAKRMRAKRGHGAENTSIFTSYSCPSARRYAKTKWASLYSACKSLPY